MTMEVSIIQYGNVFRKRLSLHDQIFGVYDAVANFNIEMKPSVLIYEKLNFASGVHMLRGCNKYNIKWVNLAT